MVLFYSLKFIYCYYFDFIDNRILDEMKMIIDYCERDYDINNFLNYCVNLYRNMNYHFPVNNQEKSIFLHNYGNIFKISSYFARECKSDVFNEIDYARISTFEKEASLY